MTGDDLRMTMSTGRSVVPLRRHRGFSLVLALTLTAMLLLLAVGAATLLTVHVRIAQADVRLCRARLNAAAASRIALGELQRLAGSDRRITAGASILDGNATPGGAGAVGRPHLAGVWKGLTSAPGRVAGWSETELPAVAPVSSGDGAYEKDHDVAFAGWLASGMTGTDIRSAPDRRREWLLLPGDGKTGYRAGAPAFRTGEDGDVFVPPESFSGNTADVSSGLFAWIAMDENQKARVDLRDDPRAYPDTERAAFSAAAARRFHPAHAADGTARWRSQTAPGERTFSGGWRSLPLDADGDGWFPREPGDAATPVRALRHDFTTESVSLLTDTANGGLRRDLCLLPLMSDADFDAIPGIGGKSGYIGFESASPSDTTGRLAWWRSAKTKALPYPASRGALFADAQFWPVWSDVREWAAFATTAKAKGAPGVVTLSTGGPAVKQITDADYTASLTLFGDKGPGVDRVYQAQWRQPVLYRMRIEMALTAAPDAPAATTYTIVPRLNIVVQLWNPFNVPMELNGAPVTMFATGLPFLLRLTGKDASGRPLVRHVKFTAWLSGAIRQSPLAFTLRQDGILKPGEIRTYSVTTDSTPDPMQGVSTVPLYEGYFPGHYRTLAFSMFGPTSKWPTSGFDPKSPLNPVSIVLRTDTDNYHAPMETYLPHLFGAAMTDRSRTLPPNAGVQQPTQNPTRLIGPGTAVAPSPLQLASAQSAKPVVVFEARLKAEAFSGRPLDYVAATSATKPSETSTDGERYSLGEPPGLYGSFRLNDGTKATLFGAPYECVAWAVDDLDDAETKWPLEVDGSAGATGFGGTGYASATGLTSFVYHHLPLHPPVGLFSLRHARLGGGARPVLRAGNDVWRGGLTLDGNPGLYNIHDAFGNALVAGYVPTDAVSGIASDQTNTGGPVFTPYDLSWIMNAAVADSWFASSLGAWDKGAAAALFPGVGKPAAGLFDDLNAGERRLPNQRLIPDPAAPKDVLLIGDTAKDSAWSSIAARLLREGGFNVNSTSVRAWRAFLAASHADSGGVASPTGVAVLANGALTAAPKKPAATTFPTDNIAGAVPTDSPAEDGAGRVNGGRFLNDAQLDRLAVAMVAEVRRRGPFLSVGEFLNRRLENGVLGLKGAVQTAIDTSGLNDHLKTTGRAMTAPDIPSKPGYAKPYPQANADLATVYTHSGVGQPGWFSQADLLAASGDALTVRGDTFVLRVAATDGASDAVARLELTVRRTYDYVDTGEPRTTGYAALKTPANRAFGRRFIIVASRWLSADEL